MYVIKILKLLGKWDRLCYIRLKYLNGCNSFVENRNLCDDVLIFKIFKRYIIL